MIKRGNINEIRPLLESYMKAYVESYDTTLNNAERAKQVALNGQVLSTNLIGSYKPFILAGYPGIGKNALIGEFISKPVRKGLLLFAQKFWPDEIGSTEKDRIFEYLDNPYVKHPIACIEYTNEEIIQEISDAGYDVHVLTFDRELFFEWANKLSQAGHRNVDKLFLDYLKENPDDSEKDWTKITSTDIGSYFEQLDSTGPVPSFWGKLTAGLHTHLKVGLSHRGTDMSDDEKALYESLIVDGNLDFVKIKKVLSGMPYRNDVYANKYESFLSNLRTDLAQPYVPAHIRTAIWAKITEA